MKKLVIILMLMMGCSDFPYDVYCEYDAYDENDNIIHSITERETKQTDGEDMPSKVLCKDFTDDQGILFECRNKHCETEEHF